MLSNLTKIAARTGLIVRRATPHNPPRAAAATTRAFSARRIDGKAVADDVVGEIQGDVDDLTKKVKSLISDSRLRQRMGKAGRAETLKWNWQAATSVLRNLQYTRAERNFKGRQRQWRRGRSRCLLCRGKDFCDLSG